MTRTIVLLLVAGLAVATAIWWIRVDAQPVTVDAIGDENQTVARGHLPRFAAKGDASRLYAFAAEHADTLRWTRARAGASASVSTVGRPERMMRRYASVME
jgi:hypothetical protein